ncbi:uncharacterized protein LOC113859265 [Abrus precatorius]|uniref:Uncharacterized protein LOC113859265 n=1 Tax=Abrus precatorius TaxID=3816 RepID=A0A8B8KVG1_ABRPR|nr:uncharacterized protein LOC113859265 [Abrus precatorius]
METPSTTRRITRSLAASNNIPKQKNEESEKSVSKTRQRNNGQQQQQDRCALVDISNDSPIVGLANGNDLETPLSSIAKQRVKKTPGSGEALLRGQVKTLLQKVEEEAEISKLSMEIRPFLQLANSPMSLLAPTPANTPQIPNLPALNNGDSALTLVSPPPSSVVEEQLISRVVNQILEGKNNENNECEKSVISRSLLLDFSDKSEVSECSSEVTYQDVTQGSCATEDDGASIWSIQVNASTHDEDDDDDDEMAEGGLLLDELCAGLNNISVNEKGRGKHTRFVYNSDDEIVEEVEVKCCAESASSNVLHLKGLPTPKGKHLRFPEDEEE